ncbi:RCC1 domain-containing protein [Saccharothrix luteola]|uniref:RCC1 domain-containing protein n=1 Tax=Saccharothrix luteola TaxID=2893018 RepID=UPI001E4513DB|nr:hypothetical protein [Saccharothrix luteola]MCC8247474.1 hypothetical protein [Saccharothrix luteola]
MRRLLALCAAVLVVLGAQPAQADPIAAQADPGPYAQVVDGGLTFVPMAPLRVLDTRDGTGTGGVVGPVGYGGVSVDLTGHLPASATAVVFNLTGTEPSEDTHVGVLSYVAISNLNLKAGETRANLVTAEFLGGAPRLSLTNKAGRVHLIVDLAGYYTTDEATRFTTTQPTRVLDTRAGGPVGPGSTREVDLSAVVPASATSVTFNLTATEPTAATHVTAYPSGAARPTASNLNLVAGQTSPNLVTVALGPDRRITLYNHVGDTHLVVDVAGYYAADRGHRFFPVAARALDTREVGGPVGAGVARHVDLTSRIPATAMAVSLNLTGTNVTADTYVTAYQAVTPRPGTSNLNLSAGRDTANAAVVRIGGDARMALYNNAGSADLVVDVAGFFATPPGCLVDCVHAWGGDLDYGPAPSFRPWLSGVTDVAAGASTAYALKSDGTVWSWGRNNAGEFGSGATGGRSAVPLRVRGLTGVTAVAAGSFTAYALTTHGTVWGWGSNQYRQLGPDVTGDSNVPVWVGGLTDVTAIAGDHVTAYALKSDGTVWGWGNSVHGPPHGVCPTESDCLPGKPRRIALPQPDGTRFTAIATTRASTGFALRSDGTVWAWGQNRRGETGTGSPLGDDVPPARVVGLTDAVAIAGGLENGYAVTADGRVWSWGYHYWGQLGTGAPCADPAACHSDVPVQVAGLTDVVAVESGSSTALALRADGSVWAWGSNNLAGHLGNGTSGSCTTTPRSEHCLSTTPVRTAISGVKAISGGGVGLFAIRP